jgi:hypothetical protein
MIFWDNIDIPGSSTCTSKYLECMTKIIRYNENPTRKQ